MQLVFVDNVQKAMQTLLAAIVRFAFICFARHKCKHAKFDVLLFGL